MPTTASTNSSASSRTCCDVYELKCSDQCYEVHCALLRLQIEELRKSLHAAHAEIAQLKADKEAELQQLHAELAVRSNRFECVCVRGCVHAYLCRTCKHYSM
jgi:hypothetical protein